ncbi:MAG: copper transporter YcnJ [Ktedonobacteraceae bacterium]
MNVCRDQYPHYFVKLRYRARYPQANMNLTSHVRVIRGLSYIALPLALCLLFLFPSVSEAHAILLRSDPAKGSVLATAPTQVRMWFTESLNPTYSTARVLNGSKYRVDQNNAHVPSSDQTEMDVNLPPNLPPAVYVVIWRTQSADDGHILTGSFIFTVANPDGSTQKLNGALPGQEQLGNGTNGSATGQLDAPTLFSLIMTTLVDLGAVFWVGAQLWRAFVIQLTETKNQEQHAILQRTEQRFDRIFALPTLFLIFFADIGVLLGQAMFLTNGQFAQAFSLSILSSLVSSGQFGTYWIMRQIVVILAALVTTYTLFAKRPLHREILSWVNLLLGLALLIALTLSGHASAVSSNIVVFAVLSDWLHLLAASLWIGGMMYIATTYLPVLTRLPLKERVSSLISVLPRYSPLAIAGVIIMSITGPFNATTRMSSLEQLLSTAYGRVLVVKVLLVGGLLLTSAFHVAILRPRLAKDYKKYKPTTQEGGFNVGGVATLTTQEGKLVERRIEQQERRLTSTLRWEPLLGVAVLLCTGLLTVFSGTLTPATTIPTQQQPVQAVPTTPANPFTTTMKTTDGKFIINFNVTPNHFGNNEFTVSVRNSQGQPDTTVGVSLYNTMEDMDMGTRHLNLQPDGQGHYKGSDQLDMSGHWQVRIDVRTQGGTSHATVQFITPEPA